MQYGLPPVVQDLMQYGLPPVVQDLIKYGLPHDVWFHVDNLSSAHVYLRLPSGASMDDIPAETLEDCAQLVKANSIQGSKQASVDVVYTMWANLHKTAAMQVGQVCRRPFPSRLPATCTFSVRLEPARLPAHRWASGARRR